MKKKPSPVYSTNEKIHARFEELAIKKQEENLQRKNKKKHHKNLRKKALREKQQLVKEEISAKTKSPVISISRDEVQLEHIQGVSKDFEEIDESDIKNASVKELKIWLEQSIEILKETTKETNEMVILSEDNETEIHESINRLTDELFNAEKIQQALTVKDTEEVSFQKEGKEEEEERKEEKKTKKKKKEKLKDDNPEKKRTAAVKAFEQELKISESKQNAILEKNKEDYARLTLEEKKKQEETLCRSIKEKEDLFKENYNKKRIDKETDTSKKSDLIYDLFCETNLATDYRALTFLRGIAEKCEHGTFIERLNEKISQILNALYGNENIKERKYSYLKASISKDGKLSLCFKHNTWINRGITNHNLILGTTEIPKEICGLFGIKSDVPQRVPLSHPLKSRFHHTGRGHNYQDATITLSGEKDLKEKIIDPENFSSWLPLRIDGIYQLCCDTGLFLEESMFCQEKYFHLDNRYNIVASLQDRVVQKEEQIASDLNALFSYFFSRSTTPSQPGENIINVENIFKSPSLGPFHSIAMVNEENIFVGIKVTWSNPSFNQLSKCSPHLINYVEGEFKATELSKVLTNTFSKDKYLSQFIKQLPDLYQIKIGYPKSNIRLITKGDYAPIWLIISPEVAKIIRNDVEEMQSFFNQKKGSFILFPSPSKPFDNTKTTSVKPKEESNNRPKI